MIFNDRSVSCHTLIISLRRVRPELLLARALHCCRLQLAKIDLTITSHSLLVHAVRSGQQKRDGA